MSDPERGLTNLDSVDSVEGIIRAAREPVKPIINFSDDRTNDPFSDFISCAVNCGFNNSNNFGFVRKVFNLTPSTFLDYITSGIEVDYCLDGRNNLMNVLIGEDICGNDSEALRDAGTVFNDYSGNNRVSNPKRDKVTSEMTPSLASFLRRAGEMSEDKGDSRTSDKINKDMLDVALKFMQRFCEDENNSTEDKKRNIGMMNVISALIKNELTDEEKNEFLKLLTDSKLKKEYPIFAAFKENLIHLLTEGKGLEDLSEYMNNATPPPAPRPSQTQLSEHSDSGAQIVLVSIESKVDQILISDDPAFSEKQLQSIIDLINETEADINVRCETMKMLSRLPSPNIVRFLDEQILNPDKKISNAAREALDNFNPKTLARIRNRIKELRAEEELESKPLFPVTEEVEAPAANDQPNDAAAAAE